MLRKLVSLSFNIEYQIVCQAVLVNFFTTVIVMQCCFDRDFASFTLLDGHTIIRKLFLIKKLFLKLWEIKSSGFKFFNLI